MELKRNFSTLKKLGVWYLPPDGGKRNNNCYKCYSAISERRRAITRALIMKARESTVQVLF
jgi:hypothetical protein